MGMQTITSERQCSNEQNTSGSSASVYVVNKCRTQQEQQQCNEWYNNGNVNEQQNTQYPEIPP